MSDHLESDVGLWGLSGVSEESPMIGKTISDRYEVVSELGRGGMGIVFLARDRSLNRKVAIKMLTGAAAHSPELRDRFRREAETASKLSHPGICGVHDFGEFEGLPFMAMAYVKGTSLADILKEAQAASGGAGKLPSAASLSDTVVLGGLPRKPGARRQDPELSSTADLTEVIVVDDMVRLIEEAARALHVAHEAGLVHRDIKPGNIMITPDGNPVILDFGLARDLEAVDQSLTESGQIVGTPAYLAPEQIVGHRSQVDRRTDVYALGVTMYECVTLQRPFRGATSDLLYHQILSGEWTSPRRLNPHLPPDLGTVIEKAMERDQHRRYETAEDFAADLQRVRAFEPIKAKAPGPIWRIRRWARRRPWKAASAAACLAIFLAGSGFLLQQAIARSMALTDKFEQAESLLLGGDFTGALEAVAQARELDSSSQQARELKTRIEQARDAAEREARKRSDLAAATRERQDSAEKRDAYVKAVAEVGELRKALDRRRGTAFDAFAPDAVRGAFARAELDIEKKQLDVERLLQEAEEALERAARLETPWGGVSAETEAGLAAVHLLHWRAASAAGDAAKVAWFRSAVERHDRAGRHERELLGRGTLTVSVKPASAEVFLFRYESYESIRKDHPVPRLVPVPTTGIGRSREGTWPGEFLPGDACLLISETQPGSIAEKAGLAAGDLIIRLNGYPCGEGVFVHSIPESALARKSGVEPLARITTANGVVLEGMKDWHDAPKKPEGELDRLRLFGQVGDVTCDRSLINVASPVRLVTRGKVSVPMRLLCLRHGEPLTVEVPAGATPGLSCERSAYPLLCAPENRIHTSKDLDVDPGSYLLFVRHPGCEDQRHPLLVRRGGRSESVVELLPAGTTPPGFAFVPPGPFLYGGDPDALWAGTTQELHLPGFFIARLEVTNREWFEFVNDERTLEKIRSSSEKRYLPRESSRLLCEKNSDGRTWRPGVGYSQTPVCAISWVDARDFVAWKNLKAEEADMAWTYDLPTQQEWEKAARGADGRFFPWGNRFDYSLTVGNYRKQTRLLDAPGGFEPRDQSPYGVWDMGGSRAEWTRDAYGATASTEQPMYHARGGAWFFHVVDFFRSAGRPMADANYVGSDKGLRLVLRRKP